MGRLLSGVLGVACFAIMTTGVIISMSRGAFLTYVIVLFVVTLISMNRKSKKSGVIICALACSSFIAITLLVSGKFEQRLRTLNDANIDKSSQMRIAVWKDAFNTWQDYAFAGVGADGFRMIFPQYKSVPTEKSFHHAESMYVQLLVDGGLIGIALFVGLVVS